MPPFDPRVYTPARASSAVAGFASAHDLPLRRFEDLLDDKELAAIDDSIRSSSDPQAGDWRRWLVFDACVAKYGGLGGVVGAIGDF